MRADFRSPRAGLLVRPDGWLGPRHQGWPHCYDLSPGKARQDGGNCGVVCAISLTDTVSLERLPDRRKYLFFVLGNQSDDGRTLTRTGNYQLVALSFDFQTGFVGTAKKLLY
jgi:hypothetical protein